jgi:hypothetical protein
MTSFIRTLTNPLLVSALMALAIPFASHANSVNAVATQITPHHIEVVGNGEQYTLINPQSPLSLSLSPTIDIKISTGSGWVKSWQTWIMIKSSFAQIEFNDHKVSKSYPWYDRPKDVHKVLNDISIPESEYAPFFVQQCNQLITRLKNNLGLSNQQIFSQDRTLEFYATAKAHADFTIGLPEFESIGGPESGAKITLTCKKWQGPLIPTSDQSPLVAEETVYVVTDSSLTLLPQSTLGGACNVTLSGVIKTLKPNAPVRFKYRHQDGHTGIVKDSQIYQVTTDHSKTAMLSHQFDIKNLDGQDEHGTIQMIGVSPEFNTKRKLYELACSTPSASGITTDLGPQAEIAYLIQERAMVGNQSCPVKVRLIGTVKTRGARQGKAIFLGNAYLSQTFNFDLGKNAQQQFIADRTINWDLNTGTPQGASHIAHGNTGGNALRFKDIRFGFNVSTRPKANNPTTGSGSMLAATTSEEYTLAASTPQQQVRLQCEMPAQVQQGFSISAENNPQQVTRPITNATVLTRQAIVKNPLPASTSFQSNKKADIIVRALNIAGNSFNKAGMVTLKAGDAIRYENGRCLFDLSYSLENKGQVTSSPFKSQLTQQNVLIDQHQNIVLQAGKFDSFYRTVGLRTGMNKLRIDTDTDKTVVESNENNNHLVKQYNVVGRCLQEIKPQLSSPQQKSAPNHMKQSQPSQQKIMIKAR